MSTARRAAEGSPPVVMVTGAGGRLGAAIATSLSERGARLALVDVHRGALEALVSAVEEPASTVSIVSDITAQDAPRRAFDVAEQTFGRVDAVVCNAGLEGPIGPIEEVEPEAVRALFEVNVFALLAFCQEAVRRFRSQGSGRIVTMASGAGTAGTGLMAVYSASKHAVVGLTRSIAIEVAEAGIQVNAVCPGCVDSPMMERIERRIGELRGTGPASFLPGIPAGRYCTPGEVGALVAWLALEAPDYMTGTTQVIDGALRA